MPLLDWLPTGENRKLWANQKTLRSAVLGLISEKRRNPGDGENVVNVLDAELSDLKEDERDKTLLGLLCVLFFAGFDTTTRNGYQERTMGINILA